jgi:hypothetical protein
MIAGTIILEDLTLVFTNTDEGQVTYTVCDTASGRAMTIVCDQPAFFAALSIAVHNDGSPNVERDYPAAESVMPKGANTLRWIP